jgi:hypothetical protein
MVVTGHPHVSGKRGCHGFEQFGNQFFEGRERPPCRRAAGDESYGNLLNAHKLKWSSSLAVILKAQFNHLVHAFHQGVEILCLGMTPPKGGNGGDVVALLVALDQHRELT